MPQKEDNGEEQRQEIPSTPTRYGPGAEEEPGDMFADDEEGEIPDWLREISGEVPKPHTTDSLYAEDAEWLADFTALVGSSEDFLGVDEPAGEDDHAGWLTGDMPFEAVEDQDSSKVDLGPPIPLQDEIGEEAEIPVPDWLTDVRDEQESSPPAIKKAPDDIPDWLPVDKAEDDYPIIESEGAETSQDIPDWLAALDDENGQEKDVAYEDQELPDWLASLTEAEQLSSSGVEGDVDSDLRDDLPVPVTPELSDEGDDGQAFAAGVSAELPPEADDELTEETLAMWAAALRQTVSAESEQTVEPDTSVPPSTVDDFADWGEEVTDEDREGVFPPESEESVPEGPEADIAEPGRKRKVDPLLPLGALALDAMIDDSLPEDDLPDWLAGVIADDESEDEELPEEEAPERKSITGELVNIPPQLVGAELPDWLQDNPLDVEVAEGEAAPTEVPDWLQAAEEEELDELLALDEAEAAALASSGEWAAILEDLPAAAQTSPGEELVSAEIPEWLEAIRPSVVGLMGDVEEMDVAPRSGPLIGVPGVINIEPAVASPRAAKKTPVEFVVTPDQRQQVALLQKLLADDEGASTVSGSWTERMLPSPLRLVLGIMLLAVVLIGLFSPAFIETVIPESPAFLSVPEIITSSANRPVLVAFEYTPAMAGELTPMAESLLSTLADQNSRILVVSQSVTGLTIGEQTASTIAGLDYDSLAFVPGEAIGLRQLGNCLNEPAGCNTLLGQQLSDEQQTILSNLGLILVFAAERDGLVNWMEQVAPLVDVPLVAGVTQALNPVAQPYFHSEQLQGVIGGLPDAAAFEQASGQGGSNSDRLWAVTLAQWVVIVVLIIGSIFWWIEGTVRQEA